MPVSQGSAGGLPGMNLKAWALVDGATGNLIKGMNVSATSRPVAGNITLTLAVALASINAVVRETFGQSTPIYGACMVSAVNTVHVVTYRRSDNTAWDCKTALIEIYE